MRSKEEILKACCDNDVPGRHHNDETYLDLEHNTIEGKSEYVLEAMKQYGHQQYCLALRHFTGAGMMDISAYVKAHPNHHILHVEDIKEWISKLHPNRI